jgi:hypothetical protein
LRVTRKTVSFPSNSPHFDRLRYLGQQIKEIPVVVYY